MRKTAIQLTELERDLIETGRNFKKSYPNGNPEIMYYLEKLIEEWLYGN